MHTESSRIDERTDLIVFEARNDLIMTRQNETISPGSRYLTAWNRLESVWRRSRCGVSKFWAAARDLSMSSLSEGEYSTGWTKGSLVLFMERAVEPNELEFLWDLEMEQKDIL
jgi:hypothetical protein